MTAKMESLFLENSRLNSRVTNLDQEMATVKSRPCEMSHSLARPEVQIQNLPTIERNEDLQRGQNAANLEANPEPQSTMAGHNAQSQGSSTAELEARNEGVQLPSTSLPSLFQARLQLLLSFSSSSMRLDLTCRGTSGICAFNPEMN